MNEELKKQVSVALKEYIGDTGMSAARIAKDIRVNEAYLSKIVNFEYSVGTTQIKDKVFAQIADFVGLKLHKDFWRKVPTRQTLMIESYLNEAKDYGVIKTIIGETGCGKTYTVNAYHTGNRHNNVYKITVSALHSVVNVIDDLLIAIGLDVVGDKVGKLRAISRYMEGLSYSGVRPLIIIDEAENLKIPVIGLLKHLYDLVVAPGYCGIVLIGTSQLTTKIEKMVSRNKIGIPQFLRRIKAGMEIIKNKAWWEDKEFGAYVKTLVGDDRIMTYLKSLAANYGEVNDFVEPALRDAERLGEIFNYEFFCVRYRLNP